MTPLDTIAQTNDELRLEDLAYHPAVLEQIELEFKNTIAKYDRATTEQELKYTQGYRKALDWIQKLPELIIDKQKTEKEAERREKAADGLRGRGL